MKHRSDDPAVPTSAKALPCPWCGSLKLKVLFTDEDVHRSTWVYCGGCSASGPIADGEIDAVLRWNTRILTLAPQPPLRGPTLLKCLLLFALLAMLAGCSSAPSDPQAKVYIEIRNQTDQPIFGYIAPGFPLPMAVSIEAHGTREFWVPRGWIPERLIFSVVEKKKQ